MLACLDPVGLVVDILVRAFIFTYTLCMQAVKAQTSLRIYADSPEPSLLENVISASISCFGSHGCMVLVANRLAKISIAPCQFFYKPKVKFTILSCLFQKCLK